MRKMLILSMIVSFAISSVTFSQSIPPKRELRAAWVATVANIDWPTNKNASSGEQIKELVTIMDSLKSAGCNAVFFQIRTECDALYDSPIEPWSYWLTGVQGKAPEPYYDPLEYAVSEAHKRGMELHAWFNPYRAVRIINDYKQAENHVSVEHPEWMINCGKYLMLDPGKPGVRKHVLAVMTDVLTRYDIDGIHFDDYFYPYSPKISNEDSLTYAKYNRGIEDIDDWRRDNINLLMAQINDVIKTVKPFVKFGISPFGIVKNEYAGTKGMNSYDAIYCDPLTWIEKKTVDYINPQLYWEIGHKLADYSKLLPWWAEVSKDVHFYVGHYSSKMMAEGYTKPKSQIGDQIRLNRRTDNVHGSVFFSAKSITKNYSGMIDSMKNDWYKYPALPPVMPWKDSVIPNGVKNLNVSTDSVNVVVDWDTPEAATDGETASYYIVYRFDEDTKINIDDPRNIVAFVECGTTEYKDTLASLKDGEYTYIVTAVDKLHNESAYNTEKKVEIDN